MPNEEVFKKGDLSRELCMVVIIPLMIRNLKNFFMLFLTFLLKIIV
jgi:hypothetical protein